MDERQDDLTEILAKIPSNLIDLLSRYREIELHDVELELDELELILPSMIAPTIKTAKPSERPLELIKETFKPQPIRYVAAITEVRLGATRSEGGSRDRVLIIGGETSPLLQDPQASMKNPPVISLDVFDTKIPLAKPVKAHFAEVLEDPVAWSRLAVEKFGSEMVNVHLTSIDPLVKDTKPAEAAKTVEDILQEVKVPVSVGGCGDPQKDLEVFERIAEMAKGERLLFNSVTLDMNIERIARAIKENEHAVIAFTPMDMNKARELNRKLFGLLPRDQIVIDTTTAALGYGLDYAFTTMERTRLAGLMGDQELAQPMASGTTNAWAAREAWMKMPPEWGPTELRGPIWEAITALTLLLAGVDYFMMMHPAAVRTLKDTIQNLRSIKEYEPAIVDWVKVRPVWG
ncbi:CO dehydrogenase/acetyl-CoA synthase subunit delta [Candidatus Bathyarchaeota archaeon]|nr:CO dehydrogenase/acetyl-CoA synthase subunit delta [Candidatus Bathyarchaeota archaeon]